MGLSASNSQTNAEEEKQQKELHDITKGNITKHEQ
jgi:hypothetical protein